MYLLTITVNTVGGLMENENLARICGCGFYTHFSRQHLCFIVLDWKNDLWFVLFCSVVLSFFVSINPEPSTAITHFSIQMKPFIEAKEPSLKLILTDLCGAFLRD